MSQPSFTVYVDNVGTPHAFIGLDDGSGGLNYYGFAPSTNALLGTHGPGKVGDGLTTHVQGDINNSRAGYIDDVGWSKTIQVSKDQYDSMVNAVSAWREANHTYNLGAILGGENCTTFVQAVARAGGITGIVTSGVVHPVSLVPANEESGLWTRDADGARSKSDAMRDPLNTPGTPAFEFKKTNPELFKTGPDARFTPDSTNSELRQNKDGTFVEAVTDHTTGTTQTLSYSSTGEVTRSVIAEPAYDRDQSWWRELVTDTVIGAQGDVTISRYDINGLLTESVRTMPNGDSFEKDYDFTGSNYMGFMYRTIEVDGANNDSYRSIATSFDLQGREDTRNTVNDDGSRDWVDFDQENSQSLRQYEARYDTQGRDDWHRTTFDDGSVTWEDLDQVNERGDRIWSNHVDAYGREDWQKVTHDSGSVHWKDFDQGGERGDRIWENMTDAQGREDWRIVTQDNGQMDRIDFDQDGSQPWSQVNQHFDSQGREDFATVYNDDGSRTKIDYDQDGSQPWDKIVTIVDTMGYEFTDMSYDPGVVDYMGPPPLTPFPNPGGDPVVVPALPGGSACVIAFGRVACEPLYDVEYGFF